MINEIPSAGRVLKSRADSGRVNVGSKKWLLPRDLTGILNMWAGNISWNNLTQPLPDKLPLPKEAEYAKGASVADRYYPQLHCTFFTRSMP